MQINPVVKCGCSLRLKVHCGIVCTCICTYSICSYPVQYCHSTWYVHVPYCLKTVRVRARAIYDRTTVFVGPVLITTGTFPCGSTGHHYVQTTFSTLCDLCVHVHTRICRTCTCM